MGRLERAQDLSLITDVKPISVLMSQKQLGLIVEYVYQGDKQKGLYRPEKYVLGNLDLRIPYPSEIYRDVAYHKIDKLLGWNVTVPITPWSIKDGDKGVLRRYWDEVDTWEDYNFKLASMNADDKNFWTKVAVLDYICGVVDRNANDILFITETGEKKVADSGLSFVDELDFVAQHSRVRDEMKGQPINELILKDLSLIKSENIGSIVSDYVTRKDLEWVIRRAKFLTHTKVVL